MSGNVSNHPLFPGKEGEDAPVVGSIHVCRQGPTGLIWAPKLFLPHELPDLETLQQLFGGGCYVLQARGPGGGRIIAQTRINLDGTPKPLSGEAPAPAPQTVFVPQNGGGGGGNEQIMVAMINMMATLVSNQARESQANMAAMLQRSDSQNQLMIASIQENSRAAIAMQSEFFKHISEMQTRQPQNTSIDVFKQGMDLGTEIGGIVKEAASGGGESGGLESTLGALVQGALMHQQGGGNGGSPPTIPPI